MFVTNWFKRTPNIIKCEYKRIKKPKDDELLIFHLKDDVNHEMVERFAKLLHKAQQKDKSFIVLNKEIDIFVAKKKRIKLKKEPKIRSRDIPY